MLSPARAAELRPALDRLYRRCGGAAAPRDPIDCVRVYASPADREIAGFIAAGLAFGRVASILVVGATRSLGADGAVAGGFRAHVRAGPRRRAVPAVRPSLDARARHRRAARRSCGTCSTPQDRSSSSSLTATTRPRPTSGPGWSRSARARGRWTCGRSTAGAQRPGVHALLPAAVRGQRVQAPQSLPALDGAARRHRPRGLERACRRRASSCRSTCT